MYALLGILRAPSHYRDYKCIKSLYEGGDMGERIIKTLRPLAPNGMKEGWSKTVIQNYY